MTDTHAPTRAAPTRAAPARGGAARGGAARVPARDVRRIAFYVVTLGAMAVSIGGQMETTSPRIGGFLAFVFAAVNDGGAILALDCAMNAAKNSPTRKWAWVAVLLAAASGGVLNAWHAILGVPAPPPAPFPVPLGLVLGLEPIVLVLVLSHLIMLAIAERRPATATGRETVTAAATGAAADRDAAPPRPRDTTTRSALPTTSSATSPATSSAGSTTSPATGQAPGSTTSSAAGLVATTGGPEHGGPEHGGREHEASAGRTGRARQNGSGRPVEPGRSAGSAPRLRIAPPPDPGRPDWMTEDLLRAVVGSALEAGAPAKRYGEGSVIKDHQLTSWKAQQVLAYIKEHDLLARAAAS